MNNNNEELIGIKAASNASAERILNVNEDEWPDDSMANVSSIIEAACSVCVVSFANAILHGDEVHRLWLLEAANAFVQGESIPAARAKTSTQPST